MFLLKNKKTIVQQTRRLIMTQKFTIQNLLQYYPKYEEGMDLNAQKSINWTIFLV